MLTKFDDYPVHQTSEPLSYLATSELNAYGRYWFNGYDPDGEFYFGIALGVYQHRQVMDCALSIVRKDHTQDAFRASRHLRDPLDRLDLHVGPMRLEIVEPMRIFHVTIDSNKTGFTADLTFRASTPAHAESMEQMSIGTRKVLQSTRLAQFGNWSGFVKVGDRKQKADPARIHGVRDRSWGYRPLGEPFRPVNETSTQHTANASAAGGGHGAALNQFFFLWAPLTFQDCCTHCSIMEYADGTRWKDHADVFPRFPVDSGFDTLSTDGFDHVAAGEHRLKFVKGTRQVASAELDMVINGEKTTIKMETLLRFHQSGIGYLHPTWGHGVNRGTEDYTSEHWNVNKIDKNSYMYAHVQNVVRATMGDRVGHGVLEQMLFGPHDRYGLSGFTDPPA
jgi:hypothetical protein